MAGAVLTSKGRITIPARVRHALGLEAGDRVEFVEREKGKFIIVAAARSVRDLKGLFQGKLSKPVSIEEMSAAIARNACNSDDMTKRHGKALKRNGLRHRVTIR
jgi:antitoxin PrlF